jgi:hypothetical protein
LAALKRAPPSARIGVELRMETGRLSAPQDLIQAPDQDRFVRTSRDHCFAVGRDGERRDGAGVPFAMANYRLYPPGGLFSSSSSSVLLYVRPVGEQLMGVHSFRNRAGTIPKAINMSVFTSPHNDFGGEFFGDDFAILVQGNEKVFASPEPRQGRAREMGPSIGDKQFVHSAPFGGPCFEHFLDFIEVHPDLNGVKRGLAEQVRIPVGIV